MTVLHRGDFDRSRLRLLATKTKDGLQARRQLALATIHDGATRASILSCLSGLGTPIVLEIDRWKGADDSIAFHFDRSVGPILATRQGRRCHFDEDTNLRSPWRDLARAKIMKMNMSSQAPVT